MNSFNLLGNQKIIPEEVAPACLRALSYYPELVDVHIEFRFQRNSFATMLAQPKSDLLFRSKKNRRYIIRMNDVLDINNALKVEDLPFDVQVGWIGHELGHIIDYSTKSSVSMIGFGIGYMISNHFRIGAERIADLHAIYRGMGNYILTTKDYILSHKILSEKYKKRIKDYYISSEETTYIIDQIKQEN